MAWRNHQTHPEETKALRAALKAAGINAKVGHGSGTAWAWLKVNLGEGQQWGEHDRTAENEWRCNRGCRRCANPEAITKRAEAIMYEVTGRHGEWGGRVNFYHQHHWNQAKRRSEPIEHPDWVDVTTLSDEQLEAILYPAETEMEAEADPEPSAPIVIRQSPVAVLTMPQQVM